MSVRSQEANMRALADLLGQDLSFIYGEKESGPNGNKKVFLNVGKAFLRALAKDLGLRDVKVKANPGGIAVSGDCIMIGMWEDNGIYIDISQIGGGSDLVLMYRTVRHANDYKGGYNQFISRKELATQSYEQLLCRFNALRKERFENERAA